MNSALKFTQATSIILIPTSTMLDPTCGTRSAVRATEITRGEVCVPSSGMADDAKWSSSRIEGKIWMLN